jgi:hypothetical protein
MESKQPKLMKGRAEITIAALVVVVSVAAGSAVLAQDSSKPATPPAADKLAADKMDMDKMGTNKMDMGKDGHGMMGMGMKSGMQQMKCCGQGMGQSDRDASEKKDEKK